MRRAVLMLSLVVAGLLAVGDAAVHAARCTSLSQGNCNACKNCKYCGHCAKDGGKCSVCKG